MNLGALVSHAACVVTNTVQEWNFLRRNLLHLRNEKLGVLSYLICITQRRESIRIHLHCEQRQWAVPCRTHLVLIKIFKIPKSFCLNCGKADVRLLDDQSCLTFSFVTFLVFILSLVFVGSVCGDPQHTHTPFYFYYFWFQIHTQFIIAWRPCCANPSFTSITCLGSNTLF